LKLIPVTTIPFLLLGGIVLHTITCHPAGYNSNQEIQK
jgi:hypothetical protein